MKRDDKPPSTDAKKKNNGSNGKQSKASDIGGLVVDSNITTEVVMHTPTRPNVRNDGRVILIVVIFFLLFCLSLWESSVGLPPPQ